MVGKSVFDLLAVFMPVAMIESARAKREFNCKKKCKCKFCSFLKVLHFDQLRGTCDLHKDIVQRRLNDFEM